MNHRLQPFIGAGLKCHNNVGTDVFAYINTRVSLSHQLLAPCVLLVSVRRVRSFLDRSIQGGKAEVFGQHLTPHHISSKISQQQRPGTYAIDTQYNSK